MSYVVVLGGLVLPRSGVVQSGLSTRDQLEKLSSHQCRLVQLDPRKRTCDELSEPKKIFNFVEGFCGSLRASNDSTSRLYSRKSHNSTDGMTACMATTSVA